MTFPPLPRYGIGWKNSVTLEVTVNAVQEPKLPELDAEFAKSLGVAEQGSDEDAPR